MECQLTDFTDDYNELVDTHKDHSEDLQWIKDNLTDLEDRFRRYNLKFRGIPEVVCPPDRIQYLHQFFQALIPSLAPLDLTIDRAHRIFKPPHIPAEMPRNVLAGLHFYQAKDCILLGARNTPSFPEPYSSLVIYADISAATAQKRKEFGPVMKILQRKRITYKWGFPTKLFLPFQGKAIAFLHLKQGLKQLHNWGLALSPDAGSPCRALPGLGTYDWHVVNNTCEGNITKHEMSLLVSIVYY